MKTLERRARFYESLAPTLAAGVPAGRALRAVGEATRDSSERLRLDRSADAIETQGFTLLEALDLWEPRLPEFERGLIDVGERSGQISMTLTSLGETLRTMSRMRRRTLSGLAYPAILIHLAVVAFSIVSSVGRGGGLNDALFSAFAGLVVLEGTFAGMFVLFWVVGRNQFVYVREAAFRWVPFLGVSLRSYALAKLTLTLRLLLNAGVNTVSSWRQSASVCGSGVLSRDVEKWAPRLEEGLPPSDALRESRVFPPEFFTIYQVGEESGRIDDSLERLTELYQEQGDENIRRFTEWTPRFVYGIVAVAIGIFIIQAASRYIGFLDSL